MQKIRTKIDILNFFDNNHILTILRSQMTSIEIWLEFHFRLSGPKQLTLAKGYQTRSEMGELGIGEMCMMDDEALSVLYFNITNVSPNSNESLPAIASYDQFLEKHRNICLDWIISWLVPIIFAIIVIVGVIGNSLVLTVVARWQQMRNTTNILLLVRNIWHVQAIIVNYLCTYAIQSQDKEGPHKVTQIACTPDTVLVSMLLVELFKPQLRSLAIKHMNIWGVYFPKITYSLSRKSMNYFDLFRFLIKIIEIL